MTSSAARQPRWEPDPRGIGVGDATSHLARIDALRAAAAEPGWVAEDPEAHLLPHLRAAAEAEGSTLTIDATATDPDGTFVVDARWVGDEEDARAVRAAAHRLIAAVAESMTAVHEHREDDLIVFEVVTGTLPGESAFATHGHTVRLRVVGAPHAAR